MKCLVFFWCVLVLFVLGCGVKGDPLPPERPPQLGKGKPTYKRAAKTLEIGPLDESWAESEDDDEETDEQER